MRVFVTGASGFIGSAVVQELRNSGHQVVGLARSDASAEAIIKAGAEPHRGDLEDIESLKSAARAADGVIHLGFGRDFSDMPKITGIDRAAIGAMSDVMAGTGKPLIIASGTMILPKGSLATEDTEPERGTPLAERALSEDLIHALSKDKGIRGMVVRFSPTVHGANDGGLIPELIQAAKRNGSVTYVGDGSARWPAVHRLDAAVLLRLALEKGKLGANYNAVAESGVPMKDAMEVVGKGLKLPVQGKLMPEAVEDLGFLAYVIASDNPTSSEKTKKELGWEPVQIGLLEDLAKNYCN